MADFCEQRQLTVSLSKTKIVHFETQKSTCEPFLFQDKVVTREEEYRHLGFVCNAQHDIWSRLPGVISKESHACNAQALYVYIFV